ncbi:cytochrome c oxidase caa3 assembly factor [Candidatus Planktophila lacus]|uniref:bifunctional copper resistance protein CopD/cytochrome c oxidase assembly protein n=1 Tax=Candidatus Planktophila lacus TaxID=1884913 RepID=UPI000BAC9945|nr:bifunctional copper resistance protein CopD/cytochrome c oxidase assembly protein [Candidatus Planktophila lacus]ASY24581.1 cytochrome c oxidase caa3 assembly factor [Candidatus Planktophila lacus]
MNLLEISKFLSLAAGITTIGLLLAIAFFLNDVEGKLGETAKALRNITAIAALTWAITTGISIVATLANILGTDLSEALDPTSMRSFISQVTLGKYMFAQLCLALLVALVAIRIRGVAGANALLLLSLAAIIAPVFESHSASSGSHALAIGSLVVHVIAISLWVGGLVAITFLRAQDRAMALPRFSALALWTAIAVSASGTANAWARLNFQSAWSSEYARMVLLKILLTAALIFFGYLNRRQLKGSLKLNGKQLGRLISVEVLIMAITTVVGSKLSTMQPPLRAESSVLDPGLAVAGIATPPPPNLWRLVSLYDPDALMIGVLVTAVALYIRGVIILTRRGDKWPVGRTVAFALGISAIDYATSGGLGVYAKFSFEYHMIAHMLLGMVAPIGIVLGAPITLALRTLPQGRTNQERGVRGTLIALLHSKPAAVFTNPVSALALFDGSLFVLYMTPLFGNLMQSHLGHLVMSVHFLLAGILFFHVIIGIDPNPRKVPHIVRIVILFAAMSIHAFFAVALISTSTLLDQGYFASLQTPWNLDLLADQHAGGSVAWAMGEIPILLALVATFIQWMRDDSRETKRIDRNEARLAAMGEPDELAQYNAYLSNLAAQDRERKGRG